MSKRVSIKQTITRYLEKRGTPYEVIISHALSNANNQTAHLNIGKAIVVRNASSLDGNSFILTVIPENHALNLKQLQKILNCKIRTVPAHDYVAFVKNWIPGIFSAIAEESNIKTIIDNQLCNDESIYFKTENGNEMIKIAYDTYQQLHNKTIFGHIFSSSRLTSHEKVIKSAHQKNLPDPFNKLKEKIETPAKVTIKQRIERITELPPMPEMAKRIIHLNANPYARAEDLAALIEIDPSLAAQIVRYARSPFFGYRGSITSIQDAIARVLGYDMVMNIALGIATASPFKIPKEGPLGLQAFWKHAIYSATLTQMIGKLLPKDNQPAAGLAYLSGLLHNFGFLLLGHLFKEEFQKLNSAILNNPDKTVAELEMDLLGVHHTEIGSWLMQAWNMPTEIITCIREHHNESYSENHDVYANLVLLADRLLKSHDIGDAASTEYPATILNKFGIEKAQLHTCLETLLENEAELETIANKLAA